MIGQTGHIPVLFSNTHTHAHITEEALSVARHEAQVHISIVSLKTVMLSQKLPNFPP